MANRRSGGDSHRPRLQKSSSRLAYAGVLRPSAAVGAALGQCLSRVAEMSLLTWRELRKLQAGHIWYSSDPPICEEKSRSDIGGLHLGLPTHLHTKSTGSVHVGISGQQVFGSCPRIDNVRVRIQQAWLRIARKRWVELHKVLGLLLRNVPSLPLPSGMPHMRKTPSRT